MKDIKYSNAVSFLQFCKGPGVEIHRVTWDELDNAGTQKSKEWWNDLPDLEDDVFRHIPLETVNLPLLYNHFDEQYHEFLKECAEPLRSNKVSEDDINEFMKGKPELSTNELLEKLPVWLHDISNAFKPKLADKLPPRRARDHKIEIIPGKEPPYQKNRLLSAGELQVVRKWLDDNLNKSFI
ncbi:hypothetical protein K3495_g12821 [Podosphaera aphanis]|nr:hypothetical protein K3495_g12821 [Podosphaera aphanis]